MRCCYGIGVTSQQVIDNLLSIEDEEDIKNANITAEVLRLHIELWITAEKFDMDEAKQSSRDALLALGVNGGLQKMLAAQMLSIHELQQRSMAYANASDNLELKKYYTNSAVKLANCFVQQANILAKLQGRSGQSITVEQVNVSDGGQAIIGTVNAPDRQ